MSLGIAYESVTHNGMIVSDSWVVTVDEDKCLVHGFGRRRDAEIALQVMSNLGIDWNLPEEMLDTMGAPKYEERMKLCCAALQW